MSDPAMWSRAKMVAEYIVRDWMQLEADERTISVLVKEIEVELDKAFDNGMKAVAVLLQASEAAALERAAKVAEVWMSAGEMQLRAGEMTAQERRTIQAVVRAIRDAIRALKEQP
jgi:hypothetical protein